MDQFEMFNGSHFNVKSGFIDLMWSRKVGKCIIKSQRERGLKEELQELLMDYRVEI